MYVRKHIAQGGLVDSITGFITGTATGIQAYKASTTQAGLATQRQPTFFDTMRWPIVLGGGLVVFLVTRNALRKR